MYLEKIIIENSGPIERLDIDLEFNDDGKPKPIILVGKNGTGKSTILGTIVDALFEFAKISYDDIVKINQNGSTPYFKVLSYTNTKVGKDYSFSFLKFKDDKQDKNLQYIEKIGDLTYSDMLTKTNNLLKLDNDWNNDEALKRITRDRDYIRDEFRKNSYCYLPPNRYEIPHWINEKAYDSSIEIKESISRKLNKPIVIQNVTSDNLKWLLDIIVDSRVDLLEVENGKWNIQQNIQHVELLKIARENVEEILSEILNKDVKFGLNWRNSGESRFNIVEKSTNSIIIPTLDALSTGESALFNMFSTIIRYSDYGDINKSIRLKDIKGIVIIDEIDLHLHSSIQSEVLPKLIKKFPNVKFIITSHSPLFIMGMEREFGKKGFNIYEMPTGEEINSEDFSEFGKSYNLYKQSITFKEEIKKKIDKKLDKTLIITEGSTDWKHLKRAFLKLKEDKDYKEKYSQMDIEFLEYEDKNSKSQNSKKFSMGDGRLVNMCEYYSRVKQVRKIIFIGDRDTAKSKELSELNQTYKNWGNNVYSFQIPVPSHRIDTPDICIEHYYKDEEIKTYDICDDGIKRRLFMGNDFNSSGFGKDGELELMCEKSDWCGKDKINIIDGSTKQKVIKVNFSNDDEQCDNRINYALPKSKFVSNILDEKGDFKNIGYKSFALIFDIIYEIVKIKND